MHFGSVLGPEKGLGGTTSKAQLAEFGEMPGGMRGRQRIFDSISERFLVLSDTPLPPKGAADLIASRIPPGRVMGRGRYFPLNN